MITEICLSWRIHFSVLSYQQPNGPISVFLVSFLLIFLSTCLFRLRMEIELSFQKLLVVISARVQTFQHDATLKANAVSQNAFLLFQVNIADKNLKDRRTT